jgi:hypothetical protein
MDINNAPATYRVTCTDSETPIALPPTAQPAALLGQDGGRYTVRVVATDPAACEAALDADPTVIAYERES